MEKKWLIVLISIIVATILSLTIIIIIQNNTEENYRSEERNNEHNDDNIHQEIETEKENPKETNTIEVQKNAFDTLKNEFISKGTYSENKYGIKTSVNNNSTTIGGVYDTLNNTISFTAIYPEFSSSIFCMISSDNEILFTMMVDNELYFATYDTVNHALTFPTDSTAGLEDSFTKVISDSIELFDDFLILNDIDVKMSDFRIYPINN